MISSVNFVFIVLSLAGCTLFHQEQSNTPPSVQTTRIVCIGPNGLRDTLSANSECTLNRSGEVELSVFANDQDDDALVYNWTSYGLGTFRDSLAPQTSWFAPALTESDFTKYVLTLNIKDRICEAINSVEDRRICQEEDQTKQLSFIINVTQNAPEVYMQSDTTISFHEQSVFLDAIAQDPDGDKLSYRWYITDSIPEELLPSNGIFDEENNQNLGSRATFIAPEPGIYNITLSVSDGQSEVEKRVKVVVTTNEAISSNVKHIQQELILENGTIHRYEIDAFEYPNEIGQLPIQATWIEATLLCAERNQRLCTASEWKNTCQNGTNDFVNSSLDDPSQFFDKNYFGLRFCNIEGSLFSLQETNKISPSGSFPNCHSGNNVFDLTGNLREWTGELNTFNEWLPSRNNSEIKSFIDNNSCNSFSFPGVAFLVDEKFDATQTESIERNSLQFEVELSEYIDQSQTGFRCCR